MGKLSGAQYILTTLIRHDNGKIKSLASRLVDTQTAEVAGAAAMQMDEFQKRQEKYWSALFFKSRPR